MIIVYVFILLIVNWWFVVEIGFKFQDQNEELENIQVMMLELMDWRKKIMSRKLTNVRTAVILFCQRWGLFFRYYMTKRKGNTKTQKIISNVPLLLIVYNLYQTGFVFSSKAMANFCKGIENAWGWNKYSKLREVLFVTIFYPLLVNWFLLCFKRVSILSKSVLWHARKQSTHVGVIFML